MIAETLVACAALADPFERLKCYDQLAVSVSTPTVTISTPAVETSTPIAAVSTPTSPPAPAPKTVGPAQTPATTPLGIYKFLSNRGAGSPLKLTLAGDRTVQGTLSDFDQKQAVVTIAASNGAPMTVDLLKIVRIEDAP